jgi:hypothetical protein
MSHALQPWQILAFASLILLGCEAKAPPAPPVLAVATPVVAAPVVAAPPAPLPAAPKAMPAKLRVLIGGDVIPHRPMLMKADQIDAALAPLEELARAADAFVVNFEASVGTPDPSQKLVYRAPAEWLSALHARGVTAVTGANNHACDGGSPGLTETQRAAQAARLPLIGIDDEDPWQPRTIASTPDGRRVCAIAWTSIVNSETMCAKSKELARAPVRRAGTQQAVRAIQKAKRTCAAVVVIAHAGDEYLPQRPAVQEMADELAEAGASAVVFHHPHVVSEVRAASTKDGRSVPVFSSLGNLVSNQGESYHAPLAPLPTGERRLVCVNGWTRLGMIADLGFDFPAEGAPEITWGYHLVWVDNEHAVDPTRKVPRITTRLFSPDRDAPIVDAFLHDKTGPVSVFFDARWLGGPVELRARPIPGLATARASRAASVHPRASR